MKKSTRYTFKHYDLLMSADAPNPPLSGLAIHELARLVEPDVETIRAMLHELRERMRWSESFLAAALGTPLVTLRKWLNGNRNPSGAARKLIVFLHDAMLGNPKRIGNVYDLAVWGGSDRLSPPGEGFAPVPTFRMTRVEFHRQVREHLAIIEREQNAARAAASAGTAPANTAQSAEKERGDAVVTSQQGQAEPV